MRYEARVSAYDVLDQVWVGGSLSSQEEALSTQPSIILHISTQIDGTGESDPREWLRDALIGLLEAL